MKGKFAFAATVVLAATMIITVCGCSTFGRKSGGGETFTDDMLIPSVDQAEARLQQVVREHIQAHQGANEPQKVPVVRKRPYYFKEYVVYPDGPDAFTMDIREEDSRIRPLVAEVTLNKIRFATRMHRKYDAAASDNLFLRDTGVETLVFELRNSRWTRTGAVFDAKTTEEQINGSWEPRREETQRVIAEEDKPGWFGRIWNRLRGGE